MLFPSPLNNVTGHLLGLEWHCLLTGQLYLKRAASARKKIAKLCHSFIKDGAVSEFSWRCKNILIWMPRARAMWLSYILVYLLCLKAVEWLHVHLPFHSCGQQLLVMFHFQEIVMKKIMVCIFCWMRNRRNRLLPWHCRISWNWFLGNKADEQHKIYYNIYV